MSGPEYDKIQTMFERDDNFVVDPSKHKNPCFALIAEWDWTEKIDGTNIRIHWDHLTRKIEIGGRTNNASIPGDLIKYLYELVSIDKLAEVFPDTEATLYGEGYGAGIQKGGGYSPTKKFILFDVLVGEKWWLNTVNTRDVGTKLGIDVVPYMGRMSLDEAVEMVRQGFTSLIGSAVSAEGLVGRPPETLFDKNHDRLIVKLKTKDFGGKK